MTSTVPRVSAIIIVLNGETFLEEAVSSIQSQSFRDWELLIVDDGSSDQTPSIAASLAAADPRIRVLGHAGGGTRGMSASRNLGLQGASGAYVAFLDADDVWLPRKLAEQADVLDHYPSAGMVYGRTLIWNSWSGGQDFLYDLGVEPGRLYHPPRLFMQLLQNRCQSPTTCNAMVRRQAAIAVGGFDNKFRSMFEDQVFFAKLLAIYPTYVSDRLWAKYRQHPRSSSAVSDARETRNLHLRYLRSVRRFLVARGRRLSKERAAVELKLGSLLVERAAGALKARAAGR